MTRKTILTETMLEEKLSKIFIYPRLLYIDIHVTLITLD